MIFQTATIVFCLKMKIIEFGQFMTKLDKGTRICFVISLFSFGEFCNFIVIHIVCFLTSYHF